MDIKQRKKTMKVHWRPISNQFNKRDCKGEEYNPETFSISKHFPFFVGCAYSIVITICKWIKHYKMLMYAVHRERFVELSTLTFSAYFPLSCFSILPLIFSKILNA